MKTIQENELLKQIEMLKAQLAASEVARKDAVNKLSSAEGRNKSLEQEKDFLTKFKDAAVYELN